MASDSRSQPILDHIVILVSPKDLLELSSCLQDTLLVIDGGEHADGLTFNKLIIFPDGVYIELIAFQTNADPASRRKHRWGELAEGTIIDWAFTLPDESDFGAVQQRVRDEKVGVVYRDPVAGGRTRPDGTVLKWAVASAEDTAAGTPVFPGYAPFWCLDRTPRRLRVPYQDEADGDAVSLPSHTRHPSGAEGVLEVAVSVPEKQLSALSSVYDGIHDIRSATEFTKSGWHFKVPSQSSLAARQVTLTGLGDSDNDRAAKISITLLGNHKSPKVIQILPGLELQVGSST